MEIAILTLASDVFWDLFHLSAPNKLEYCLKWKVDLIMGYMHTATQGNTLDHQRQRAILDAFKRYDWVWFLGADTLIMNQTIDVRQFLDPNADFIIAQDPNGLNNDSCFYRKCDETIEFINRTIKHLETEPHDWYAQSAAKRDMPNFKLKIVPQKLFNCYPFSTEVAFSGYPKDLEGDYKDGDFVLHLPSISNDRRIQVFKEQLPKVIK
jgi:hypothetical protein